MEEKRQFPRYKYPIEVEYSPKGEGVIYSRTITKNISKGGLCINVLSRLVKAGDRIKLDIYPDGDRKNSVLAKGTVVWVKETSNASNPITSDAEAGIKFTEADAGALERLLAAIT